MPLPRGPKLRRHDQSNFIQMLLIFNSSVTYNLKCVNFFGEVSDYYNTEIVLKIM